MNSKKCIWGFRVAVKTFKNFRVPREVIKGRYMTRPAVKVMKKSNNKRARRLDYCKLLAFE